MVWLWDSWDEYVSHVDPKSIGNPAVLRVAHSESSIERQQRLFKAVAEFERLLNQLISAGFDGAQDQDGVDVSEKVGSTVSDLSSPSFTTIGAKVIGKIRLSSG